MRKLVFVVAVLLVFLGAAPRKSIVPTYEKIKTKNGVEIYFFPSASIPLFQIEFDFDGGSDLDPEKKSGLGMMAASMARKGVPGLDEDAVSRKIDDMAAGIDFGVTEEHTMIAAYGLNEHADKVVDLMFEELAHPTFPEKPFQRMKLNHLESIRQLSDSPGQLASYVLDLLTFNRTPKARPGSGLIREVEKVELGDVKAYYPNIVRTDRLKVLVIGGVDHKAVLDRIVQGLEKLPCSACGKPTPAPKTYDYRPWHFPRGSAVLVSRPGISESHVRMGFVGPKRKIPEFYDLRVAETILSGYFGSRMNLVIREKLNLTYNISAGFSFGDETGTFNVSTSTRDEKVGELVVQVNKLLRDFVEGGVTDQELQNAKDYLTGSFPLGLQNLYVIAGAFFHGTMSGLDPNFMDIYQSQIEAVTKESMKLAVKKYFPLNQMITVITGDPKEIGPRLTKEKINYVVRKPQIYL